MIRRLLVAGAALSALGVAMILFEVLAPPRASPPRAPIDLNVTDARQLECRDGAALWSVGADIRVHGRSGTSVDAAALSARYTTNPDGRWRAVAVDVTATDSFAPGEHLNSAGTWRTQPTVRVALPCDVHDARLVAAVHLSGEDGPCTTEAAFVSQGVSLSSSSIGLIGLVALGLTALIFGRAGTTRTKA